MKALNLKGISWIMVWAMMGLVMLAAGCSDDDDAAKVTPTFPELKEINIPANGTGNLSFDANMDWTLSSDASWCRFVDGEFVQTTMSGTAGQQTVRITVSDDDQNYENDDVAQITLRMGGQSQVICKVTRAKKELQALTVTDGEGNTYDETHPLTIKGNTATEEVYTSVKVEAEEGTVVGLDAYPDWLTVRNNEAEGTFELTFNTENTGYDFKYAIDEESAITFKTEDGRSVTVPLVYEGMDAASLAVSPYYPNLTARANGMLVTESGEAAELSSTVTARNDEYEIVEFVQNGEADYDFSANGDLDWITVSKNGAEVTFSVSANETGASRNAVIMAFPKAVYEEISGNLEGAIIETIAPEEGEQTTGIASKYGTFVIAYLSQETKTEQAEVIEFVAHGIAMKSYMGTGWEVQPFSSMGLEEAPVTIEKLAEGSVSGVDCKDVYRMTVDNALVSMIQDYGDDSTYFVILAEGMGSEQTIGENEAVSGVRGVAVNFSEFVMDETNPDGWSQVDRSGWGVVVSSPTSVPAYAVVVRNADGSVAAYCEVGFAE